METIIISNTCVGSDIISKVYNCEYNNPFISTLIPNDEDYIKLCNNLVFYITKVTPIIGSPRSSSPFCIQNDGIWYKHDAIRIPYPVIYLDDIEIHCIHETSDEIALAKFLRRLDRTREIIFSRQYRIIPLFSYGELINNHIDIGNVIERFILCGSENIFPYFLGPTNYYKESYDKKYIIAHRWDNMSLTRNRSHIYVFNNQPYAANMFTDAIKKLVIPSFF